MGVVLSTAGAVTIVLSAKTEEEKVPSLSFFCEINLVITGRHLESDHSNSIFDLLFCMLRRGDRTHLSFPTGGGKEYHDRPRARRYLRYRLPY